MNIITGRSGLSRRRAPYAGSRRTDARVSVSSAPVVSRGCNVETSRVTERPNRRVMSAGWYDDRREDLSVQALPRVVQTQHDLCQWHDGNAAAYDLPQKTAVVSSHPLQLSDSSGSESDTSSHACSIRRKIARKLISSQDQTRLHRAAPAANTASRVFSVASASSGSPQEGQKQSVAWVPPSIAAHAAPARHKARSTRTLSAVLSLLIMLLAVGASSRVLHAALTRRSVANNKNPVIVPSASSMSQPDSSHEPAGTPAAAASFSAATQPVSQAGGFWHSSRQLMHTVAQASKLAASWLGREAITNHIGTAAGTAATSRSPGQNSKIRHQKGVGTAAISGEASVTSAGTAADPSTTPDASKPQTALPAGAIQMYAVIDDSAISPYKGATWGKVIRHIAKRLQWSDSRFILNVITQGQLKDDAATRDSLSKALSSGGADVKSSPIFVGIAVTDPDVASYVKSVTAKLPTALFWDSGEDLDRSSRVDGFAPASAGPLAQLLSGRVGFSKEARAANVLKTLGSLWSRHTSDDLLFIWLVLLNEYVTPVPAVANTTKGTDLQSLYCMIKNCGQKIVNCVTDTTCKKGLDCLEGCAFNDQVCQYRCIVSYETPKFEQFALCILQLHNCRGLDAQMPMVPDPAPMTSWRGKPMTHEIAESLFIGWKQAGPQLPEGGDAKLRPYSWLVAAGKNPAYDYFPCQHQLYSYGKGKGQMWYEPVFKAITLDGQEVWRRRRYRVRRGSTPGTFYYSVLDNGVTSNEYWRIIDCAEDLTYCLFYYSGAAAAAGLSYSGAVLGTVDGSWPAAYTERIHAALQVAGIEPWELSTVDNSQCVGAPL